jgi:hypothetical protein
VLVSEDGEAALIMVERLDAGGTAGEQKADASLFVINAGNLALLAVLSYVHVTSPFAATKTVAEVWWSERVSNPVRIPL